MNDLVITADRVDVGDKVNADSTKLHKYYISNPWTDVAVVIHEVNYLGVKAVSDGHKKRKQRVDQFIITKVREVKEQTDTVIGAEMTHVLDLPWTISVHNSDPNY